MEIDIQKLVDDFVAERRVTQTVLENLPEDAWYISSSADGWSLRDCAAHVGSVDEGVVSLVTTGKRLAGRPAGSAPQTPGEAWLPEATPAEFMAHWIQVGKDLEAVFRAMDTTARLPWGDRTMNGVSMVTARLMEHWSHGLDLNDAAGVPREDSDRLIHVAQLGYMTRRFIYENRGLPVPEAPIYIELQAPSGATWTWGPPEAEDQIRGTAGDFCRVAARRIHLLDTALTWKGDLAAEYLQIAQTFAGPAGEDRPRHGYTPGVVYCGRLGGSTNPADIAAAVAS